MFPIQLLVPVLAFLAVCPVARVWGEQGKPEPLYAENIYASAPEAIPSVWDDLLKGVATKDDWPARRAHLYRLYLALIADEAKPSRVPLDLKWHEKTDVDGVYVRHLISYNVESGERAHAFLAIPKNAGAGTKFPAVVCLHGTHPQGMHVVAGLTPEKNRVYFDELARRGFVAIAPEHFVAEFRTPKEGAYETGAFYKKHPNWTAVGKFTFEHSIAIDVLESLPEVDKTRIGVMGHSLGGQGAIFLAAYDERIKAAASNCAAYTFRQTKHPEHWARDRWYVYFRTMREKLVTENRLPDIDFHEIMALVAPRALLDCSGLNDGDPLTQRQRVLMLTKVMDVYDLLGASDRFAFFVHGKKHSIERESRQLIYAWLEEQLDVKSPERGKETK